MLSVKRDDRGFVEVKQASVGGCMSTITYSYFDTDNWLQTTRGAFGAVPTLPVLPGMRLWVEDFYLPKIRTGPAPANEPIVRRPVYTKPALVEPVVAEPAVDQSLELEPDHLVEACVP